MKEGKKYVKIYIYIWLKIAWIIHRYLVTEALRQVHVSWSAQDSIFKNSLRFAKLAAFKLGKSQFISCDDYFNNHFVRCIYLVLSRKTSKILYLVLSRKTSKILYLVLARKTSKILYLVLSRKTSKILYLLLSCLRCLKLFI